MYFSKTVYLIFTILIVRILLSNAQHMHCHQAHNSAKYHEYIEGLLKLKGRMLSHAMKILLQKEDEQDQGRGGGGGESDEHFIDLGSHPIATPRTLHAEDYTMPPQSTTTCGTTTDVDPAARYTTIRIKYNKYGGICNDREEATTARRHESDTEETTTKSCTNEGKSGHDENEHTEENREQDVTTTKHDVDNDEAVTQRHHHKDKQDEENSEEEQHTTRKHDLENEETVTERHNHKSKNQHTYEEHEEATTTRESELESRDGDKCQNTTKSEQKSEEGEEETPTKKPHTEKEEESTHRKSNKTNENDNEETVTRKEGTSTKIVSCTCNKGGTETSTAANEGKDTDSGRKHSEHETSIERPQAKSNETSTAKNEEDEFIRNIALALLKSHVLQKNETTTEGEQTGNKNTTDVETEEECSEENESTAEEEEEENETCEPEEEEVESTTTGTRENLNESKAELQKGEHIGKTSAHEPTDLQNYKLLIFEPTKYGIWKQVGDEGHKPSGPNKEGVANPVEPHTTCGPDEEEITNPAEPQTTCGPDEEEITNPAEPHTTCGPDEEEVPNPTEKSANNETQRTSVPESNNNRQHFKLLILEPLKNGAWRQGGAEEHTTCGPDEEEITNPAEPQTTCGPDEEVITESVEPYTTCGPDEEEITDPAEKSAEHEIPTTKPPNPINVGSPLGIFPITVTTPTPGVPNERPTDMTATNTTTLATPTSMDAYPTMCFPITEPPAVNGTSETTTQASYQNVSVTPSMDTQTTTTPVYQNTSATVTQSPQSASMENTTQALQTTPAPITQETTTQPTRSPQEVTTVKIPANNTEEVTTQSFSGYATMCYPVTEASKPSATTTKPPPQTNTQKLRRHLKQRWKAQKEFHAPSMRAKLRRAVRELRARENRAVDKSKMLTLVHYAGQPRYQRYYLRGLKGSGSSDGRYKKHEIDYYPDEQEDPKFERRSKNLQLLDYEELRDEEKSGIFEDAMRVKLPFSPTKQPTPQPMAQQCAGKNHDIQHFRHQTAKKPMSFMPLDQCKKCETETTTPPYIIPFPKMDTEPDDVCKSPDDREFFSLDTNFGAKDKFDNANGCNDFGIEQFTKKSQAQISLENFRRAQAADPIQQKLSFMGRLLSRKNNCGNTKTPKVPNVLPNAQPTALPVDESTSSKAKSFFPLQKLFNKWFRPKPNCDKCHQKVKLKDLLHHRDSIKRLNGGSIKTKRQKSGRYRNIRQHNTNSQTRRRHRSNFGSELHSKHNNKRSKHRRYCKANKAGKDRFTEHRKRRRHALRRRPRRRSIYEESNGHLNWRSDDVPDLPKSWNGNFESDAYNNF